MAVFYMIDKLTRFIHNHKPIAAVAVVYAIMSAMLLPEFLVKVFGLSVLGMEGWLKIIHEWFPWTCLSIVPLLWLGKRSRYVYVPLIVVWLVLAAVIWFARIRFRMALDGHIVGIVMASSLAEIKWFLGSCIGVNFFVGLIGVLFILFVIIKLVSLSRYCHVSKCSITIGFILVCLWTFATVAYSPVLDVLESLSSVHLVVDSLRNFSRYKKLVHVSQNPSLPKGVRLCQDGDVTGVVVIGESATRNHWGLYGYERDTTPCLSAIKDQLVVFEDVVTPTGHTSEALPLIFTTLSVGEEHYSYTMSQILRRAGYDVALYSNQEKWDTYHGVSSLVFSGCEPMNYYGHSGDKYDFDDKLLPILRDALTKMRPKRIVFVHLIGSHAPSEYRYPHCLAKFNINVPMRYCIDSEYMVNHYDNSVWYTDKFLGEIVKILDDAQKDNAGGGGAWMIYIADHGESPNSVNWRTMTDRDVWDVPFVVWMSESFKNNNADLVLQMKKSSKLKLQSDQLFYGLLRFMGVTGVGAHREMDFLCDEFSARKPRVIENGKDIYPWD